MFSANVVIFFSFQIRSALTYRQIKGEIALFSAIVKKFYQKNKAVKNEAKASHLHGCIILSINYAAALFFPSFFARAFFPIATMPNNGLRINTSEKATEKPAYNAKPIIELKKKPQNRNAAS